MGVSSEGAAVVAAHPRWGRGNIVASVVQAAPNECVKLIGGESGRQSLARRAIPATLSQCTALGVRRSSRTGLRGGRFMAKNICVVGVGRWGNNHVRTLAKQGCLEGFVEVRQS